MQRKHLPVYVDIHERRSIAIYGKGKFGKTNLLRLLLKGILQIYPNARFVLLDSGRGDLTEKYLPELYETNPDICYFSNDLKGFRDYLFSEGYWDSNKLMRKSDPFLEGLPSYSPEKNKNLSEKNSGNFLPDSPHDGEGKLKSKKTPFTVFMLQSRKLFQKNDFSESLMTAWMPEAVENAASKGYLFLFPDVRPITEHEIRETFKDNLSTAFLLDNIGEFVADRGGKSVFGEMDPKELKARFARCSVGDGYWFDIVADELKKLKFIKM